MKDNEYQCVNCGGIFEKGRSDFEAKVESEMNFPGLHDDDACYVCDDCFNLMMQDDPNLKSTSNDKHS